MPSDLAVVFPRAGVTGGVERVALDLLRFEIGRRDACFVGVEIDDVGIPHIPVSLPRTPTALRPLAFRRAAARALLDLAPHTTVSFGAICPPGDVYWVHSVHAAWLARGGDVYVRGLSVPPVARRLLLRHQTLLRLEREYFTNHHPRAILCTSQREIDDLSEIYGVDRQVMHAVPNPFDSELFSVAKREGLRDEMRAAIGAGSEDIVVLMVANEWHRKGLGALLGAVKLVNDTRVRIDLVGKRSPEDYLAMASRLGLADKMRWHGPSSDVARFHAAADIFALPTTYEPFGLVIIEAMASGLPVVTSALAGASAAIRHGLSGFKLEDPTDETEIATALAILLDRDTRSVIGAQAALAADPYEVQTVMTEADRLIFNGR